jgi:hypothetical protein
MEPSAGIQMKNVSWLKKVSKMLLGFVCWKDHPPHVSTYSSIAGMQQSKSLKILEQEKRQKDKDSQLSATAPDDCTTAAFS